MMFSRQNSADNKACGTVLLILLLGGVLRAQDSTRTSLSGFIDTYYCYCFLNAPPALGNRSYTTQPLRHDEFNLNLGYVKLNYQSSHVRGNFALHTGTYVEANYAAEPALLRNILEANAGTLLGNGVWVDMGVFPSHIGFEGAVSKDNWTYSRSLLADYSPYYEAGLSVTGTLNQQLTLRALILNGWQNIAETNRDKAFGTQVQYSPTPSTLFNWSTFIGNEQPDSLPSRLRIFNDFYSVHTLSPDWNIALMFDIGVQRRPGVSTYDAWHAASVMTQRRISTFLSVSGRIEYYFDPSGVIVPTGTKNNFQVFGVSANIDYAPSANVVWRVEVRSFSSRDAIYSTESGPQSTHGFAVLSTAISL